MRLGMLRACRKHCRSHARAMPRPKIQTKNQIQIQIRNHHHLRSMRPVVVVDVSHGLRTKSTTSAASMASRPAG